MVHVVIHAGFHKTGTKSVQAMINTNRAVLDPVMRCYLKSDVQRLTELAKKFSATREQAALRTLGQAERAFFASLDPLDPRPILISAEDLSGYMPGRRKLTRYDATPKIMAQIAASARASLGDETQIDFYFSTRQPDSWFASLYWQNLRSKRLTDDLPEFVKRHVEASKFDSLLADIRASVAPARVSSQRLDHTSGLPQGPLTPLLDLLDIAPGIRTALSVLPAVNAMPYDGLSDVFLALNRSGMEDDKVADAKRHILRLARRDR
ncbi:hypothetical protein EDD52_101614 [Primorskyibacter sedentarius]|uniref:Sulfotransferase family protein n=2 Tax=Primorskyibacter sedentarius TaxID=745311 RepID=A0A4R3JPH5_9RHOB|nr:hypothetical protein EDD52_101614 [Primorskyibacter sedentarius]